MALACFWLYDTVHSGQSSLDPLRTPAGNGASKYCSHRDVSRKCRAFQFRRPPLNQFLCPSGPPPFFSQRLSKTTGKPHTTAPSPRITFCHASEHASTAQKWEHDGGDATFSYCSSSLTKPGFGFISPLRLRTYLKTGSARSERTLRAEPLLSGLRCTQLLGGHDVRNHNGGAPAEALCERLAGARCGGGEAADTLTDPSRSEQARARPS